MPGISVGVQFDPGRKPGVLAGVDISNPERLLLHPRFRPGRTLLGLLALAFAMYAQLDAWSGREWVAFAFATLGAFAAIALLTLRRRIVLDRREGLMVAHRGRLRPHFETTRALADFDRITIGLGERPASQGETTVYPVRLEGRGEAVEIDAPGYWETARNLAEEIAAFLGLPLLDPGRSGALDPDQFDRTVGRRGGTFSPPNEPRELSCRVEADTGDLLRIVIPPPDYRPFLGITLVVWLFLLIPLFVEPLLPALILAWVSFEMARAVLTHGGVLEVTPGALRLTGKPPWGPGTRTIPAAELEDLVLLDPEIGGPRTMLRHFSHGVLVARSDRESIRFGYGLAREELTWLREKILRVLGGRTAAPHRPKPQASASSLPAPALIGMLAGAAAAHATRGPLSICVALPFLQHLVSTGALAGLSAGLLARGRIRAALAAAAIGIAMYAGSERGSDFVQDRPRLTQNPRYLKAAESLGSRRYLAGFLPSAALANVAAFEATLTIAEVLRRRRRRAVTG